MFALHHNRITRRAAAVAASLTIGLVGFAGGAAADEVVAMSPWGADDEIGRLNLMTDASRFAVLGRISSGMLLVCELCVFEVKESFIVVAFFAMNEG